MINLYITFTPCCTPYGSQYWGMVWLISFAVAIIIDLSLKRFLPKNALAVYMRLIDNSYLNIFITLFVVLFVLLNVLVYLDLFHIHICSELNLNLDSGIVFIESAEDSINIINNTSVGVSSNEVVDAANTCINIALPPRTAYLTHPVWGGGEANINLPYGVQPNATVIIPTDPLYSVASTLSATGGLAAGVKVANMIGGGYPTPMQKLGIRLRIAALVQTSSLLGTNLLQSKYFDSDNNKNNFIQYFSNNLDNNNHSSPYGVDYSQFPLNLIPELDVLSSLSIFFFFFILNIYTVRFIIGIDFSKYLPNNLLGRLVLKLINRYISMWSKMSRFFLILGWCLLLVSILMVKLCVYFIVNA